MSRLSGQDVKRSNQLITDKSAADFSYITDNARRKLKKELLELKETIGSLLEAMGKGV